MTLLQPIWLLLALALGALTLWLRIPRQSDHWHHILPRDILEFLSAHNDSRRQFLLPLAAATVTALALAAPAVEKYSRPCEEAY